MLRILTIAIVGVIACLGPLACNWDGNCTGVGVRCSGDKLESCQQTGDGYGEWREIADCTEFDAMCVELKQAPWATCRYGPRVQ